MAAFQGEFCAVNMEVAFRAKPNGQYIEVAVLQRAGIARVYCTYRHSRSSKHLFSIASLRIYTVYRESYNTSIRIFRALAVRIGISDITIRM